MSLLSGKIPINPSFRVKMAHPETETKRARAQLSVRLCGQGLISHTIRETAQKKSSHNTLTTFTGAAQTTMTQMTGPQNAVGWQLAGRIMNSQTGQKRLERMLWNVTIFFLTAFYEEGGAGLAKLVMRVSWMPDNQNSNHWLLLCEKSMNRSSVAYCITHLQRQKKPSMILCFGAEKLLQSKNLKKCMWYRSVFYIGHYGMFFSAMLMWTIYCTDA